MFLSKFLVNIRVEDLLKTTVKNLLPNRGIQDTHSMTPPQ